MTSTFSNTKSLTPTVTNTISETVSITPTLTNSTTITHPTPTITRTWYNEISEISDFTVKFISSRGKPYRPKTINIENRLANYIFQSKAEPTVRANIIGAHTNGIVYTLIENEIIDITNYDHFENHNFFIPKVSGNTQYVFQQNDKMYNTRIMQYATYVNLILINETLLLPNEAIMEYSEISSESQDVDFYITNLNSTLTSLTIYLYDNTYTRIYI